jgi:hypothetical protein
MEILMKITDPAREERIRKFRRDCVEAMVYSTADNIYETGNSPTGVSVNEVAAYYIVRSSYCELDIQVVVQELEDMAEIIAPDYDNLSPDELEEASLWNEDDIKVEVVEILRSLSIHTQVVETLVQCAEIIDLIADERDCTREETCECGACDQVNVLDSIGHVLGAGWQRERMNK